MKKRNDHLDSIPEITCFTAPMNTPSVYLQVDRLTLSFRTESGVRRVLNEVSFEVYKGQTTAIVGESGSGKSVSSMSIMQLLRKGSVIFENGKFLFSDREIDPSDPELREMRGKKIAMVFQEPMTSLNPVMTCGDQVAESLIVHQKISRKEASERTLGLFREVKLPRAEEMLKAYPHQLSGGQRQRVMIAMALANYPELLIADEPTTALDVTVQKSILDLLADLQKRYHMAMIFITHDLGVVKDIAHHVVVMKEGMVVESGPAEKVLNRPENPYTKGLMACRPVPGVKLDRLLTVEDMLRHEVREPERITADAKFTDILVGVRDLSKVYVSKKGILGKPKAEVRAVDQVSFDIFRGEALGLVGESGCGKTTLSRMLLGLIPASSGSVEYQGSDLMKGSHSDWKKWRKDLQIIFQDPYSALNPKHTVGEILIEPILHFGLRSSAAEARKRAAELLAKVGMQEDALSRYPHEFSGGQRQRIVIARALSVEPKFIICDESVAALDVSVQAQVLNLLTDLKKELGLTYLFISHDLGVVYQMCDRIMVMYKGKIEEIGPAEDVFHRPQSAYTLKLLQGIPGMDRV